MKCCGFTLSPAVSVSQKFPFPEFWLNENWLSSEGRGSKSSVDQITPGRGMSGKTVNGELPVLEPKSGLVPGPNFTDYE